MKGFHKGVISAREAESILRPLHHHIKECMSLIKESTSGYTPRNASKLKGALLGEVEGLNGHDAAVKMADGGDDVLAGIVPNESNGMVGTEAEPAENGHRVDTNDDWPTLG